MPRVSVLIPTYNRQQYLVEAIQSIEGQTYRDWEIVVVDDGSTDDTRSVLEAFYDSVRYFHQQNQGVSTARNLAFRESTGEYIFFLDSDDYLLPNALADLSAALDANPACDVAYSDGYVVDSEGVRRATLADYSPRPFVDTLETFVVSNPLGLHGTLFRRLALKGIEGPYDPLMVGYEDWDMFMRLKESGATFQFFPVHTACYRFHGGNKSAPKSSLAEKRRQSLVRNRLKVIEAPWFEIFPLTTKRAFFEDFLTKILRGDRIRQAAVTSHRTFQQLPAKVRSALLYRLVVDNILDSGADRSDQRNLSATIKLDPANLKAYPLFALTLAGHHLPEKALSWRRRARTDSDLTDPVTQILRSRNVA
jgi:glycosyltransferase involved in cell wall biosynthesis